MKEYQFALNRHAIVSTTDIDGNIVEVNDNFCKMSGFSREELIGKNHNIINSGYQDKAFFSKLWDTIKHGKTWQGEIRNKKKDGTFYWVKQTIVPFLNVKKNRYEYIAICSDITAQKEQQKQLHESRYFMEKITDTMAQGVYVLNIDGMCTFWNSEAEKILGWSASELINKNLHDLIHYQDEKGNRISQRDCPTLKSIQNKQKYYSENEFFTHKNGKVLPIAITSVPLIENDRVVGSVAVFNDISLRRKNEKILNDAIVHAQEANQAKSDFLANMGHEIRTPMNGIIGMTDLALETDLTEEQRSYLEIVKESSSALLVIINDILDFSKIESGKVILEKSEFHFENLMEEIVLMMKQKAEAKGLALVYEIAAQEQIPVFLVGDAQRLKQVLVNLLDNSIKFTTTGQIKLRISLKEQNTRQCCLLFTVTDTGIGVSKSKQASVFESFLQADSSVLRKFGGTGLGLSISKQIVELMGGEIYLESEEGVGSCFSFTSHFEYKAPDNALLLDEKIESPIEKKIKKSVKKMDNNVTICNWDAVVKRLGGADIVEMVIELFFEEQQGYLDNINNALAQENVSSLKNELHTLKGVCSTLGADRVEKLIKAAEMLLVEKDGIVRVSGLIKEIEENIKDLNLFFKDKLKK